jgi:hypothetical protein
VAGEGDDEVLQLEEETGEVRHDPKGADGGDTVELTEGKKKQRRRLEIWRGAATVRSPARTRGQGKGRVTWGALRRENGGGRGKGCGSIGMCLLNGTVEGRRGGGAGPGLVPAWSKWFKNFNFFQILIDPNLIFPSSKKLK